MKKIKTKEKILNLEFVKKEEESGIKFYKITKSCFIILSEISLAALSIFFYYYFKHSYYFGWQSSSGWPGYYIEGVEYFDIDWVGLHNIVWYAIITITTTFYLWLILAFIILVKKELYSDKKTILIGMLTGLLFLFFHLGDFLEWYLD